MADVDDDKLVETGAVSKADKDFNAKMEAELEKKKLDENPESWSKKREEIHEICERGDVVALIAHLKTEAGRKTLEKPDPSGWRPLHWAASNNRNKIRALFMLKQEDANNLMLVQEERDNIRKTFVTDMMDALKFDYASERIVMDDLKADSSRDDRLLVSVDIDGDPVIDMYMLHRKDQRQAKLMKLQQDLNKEGSEVERPESRPPMQLLNELKAQMQDKSSALLCGNVTEKLDTTVGVASMQVFCGHQCVKVLLEAKADPNVPDLCQNNPIFKAVSQGQMESTRLLLDAGAKIYIHNIYGDTPLHRAAWSGRYDLIKVLLEHKPPPKPRTADAEDSDEERAAAESGIVRVEQPIEYFNASKYINERNQFGDTALHMAAFKGRIDCVNLLLNYDADIGFTNMLGWTALHCACAQGHTAIVQILMLKWKQKGLPWTHLQTTTTGDSFCHLAIKGARIELINWLLKTQGPAFAKQNRAGEYPVDVLVALISEDKKGKGGKKGKAGGKGGKKGKKGAAEPEVIEVPIRTQGFFPVIVGMKQDQLRALLPAVTKETEDQKTALAKKAEAGAKGKK